MGYYLSVEKAGFNTSGLLTLTWINGLIDSNEYLEIIQKEFKNQTVLNDLEFELAQESNFNGMQSISCRFTFNTLSVKHKGTVYVFSKGEKTYSVVKQGALEDASENKKGFNVIESTFKIEEVVDN